MSENHLAREPGLVVAMLCCLLAVAASASAECACIPEPLMNEAPRHPVT